MGDEKVNNYAETYKIIDGRKYLNDTNCIYYLPNDEEESDRTNIEHNVLRYVWQGNFSSNIHEKLIKGNTRVIDLGCGSGKWLTDMALKYPLSTFIGIDVYPMTFSTKLDNVAFLQHNLLDRPGIPFPDNTFDFVFLRALSTDVKGGWPYVISEMVRVAKSNGCIEFANFDLERDTYEGPILNQLHDATKKLHYKDNLEMLSPKKLIELINQTNQTQTNGITDIKFEERSSPLGWGGKLGELTLLNLIFVYKGFKTFFLPIMKVTGEEYDNMLKNLGNECIKYKPRFNSYRVWGVKS